MGRLVFWLGDVLVRFEKRPCIYFGALFTFMWIATTLVAHFAHLWAGQDRIALPWGDAAAVGLGFACLATLFAYFLYWRKA